MSKAVKSKVKVIADDTQRAMFSVRYSLDFEAFCREVLGYKDMISHHSELCRFMQNDQHRSKLILMPRYSFKSCISTAGYALWHLTRHDSDRILIYSDTGAKAEGFLSDIKNHIEGRIPDSHFRKIYGAWELDPREGTYNQGQIVIAGRAHAQREPSIDTGGIETSKVGKHYDVLIFDDIVSDQNVTTKEQMDKVAECYRRSLSLLKPGGQVIMVGTRWHFGDLYGRILAENHKFDRFGVFHRRAIEGEEYLFNEIGLDRQFLEEQKNEQGSYIFSCLYQNDPVDDETATFKARDFSFYDPHAIPDGLYITCCLDPIPPHEGTDGDDAALTVVGTDDKLNMYILDIVAGRMQPSDQIEELFRLHEKWTINTFGVETNSFQKVMKRDIEYRYAQERQSNSGFKFFHIEEFVGASLPNKELRIRGLQPYHERGALLFPGTSLEMLKGEYMKLAYQLLQFPKSAKDDISDSLAGHIQIHRRGTRRNVPVDIPYTSAAWFEREYRKKEVREMNRRPRFKRRPLPELTFS